MLLVLVINFHTFFFQSAAQFLEISQAFLTYAKVEKVVNTTIWPSGQVAYPSSLPFIVPYEKKHLASSHRHISTSVFFSTLNKKKASMYKAVATAYLTEVLEFREG